MAYNNFIILTMANPQSSEHILMNLQSGRNINSKRCRISTVNFQDNKRDVFTSEACGKKS